MSGIVASLLERRSHSREWNAIQIPTPHRKHSTSSCRTPRPLLGAVISALTLAFPTV